MLVILGRLSKCVTKAAILSFGKTSLKRLQSIGYSLGLAFVEATFCHICQGVDDGIMAGSMSAFVNLLHRQTAAKEIETICFDGKTMRGTVYENGRNPDIVSAYSLQSGLTLATDVCEEKNNEIKSVPELLDKLDNWGCVAALNAISFQKSIIDKIKHRTSRISLVNSRPTQGPCAMGLRINSKPLHRQTSTWRDSLSGAWQD